jgi:hypothetical protein
MTQLEDTRVSLLNRRAAGQKSSPNIDLERVRYGACLVGSAFLLLGVVFAIAVWRFAAARDVTAAVGSVATVVGTIVGAFFGVHIGSAAKESVVEAGRVHANAMQAQADAVQAHAYAGRAQAETGRDRAEKIARMALAKLDPQAAEEIVKAL